SEYAAGRGIRNNTEIADVNRKIAGMLAGMFARKTGQFDHRKHLFAFDRGTFLVYVLDRDENEVDDLVVAIRDGIYKIVENHRYHIYIQPFFGIAAIDKLSTLVDNIGNAMLARDAAESNFESVTYFDESMKKSGTKSEIDEIIAAFEKGEFKIYYQPKYNLAKKQFTSSEALVRWESPTRGLLNPGKFMDKIEAAGLIHELDTYVFKQVCADLNEAKRRGRRLLPVSVNFSLYEFYSTDFLSSVIKTIDDAKLDHSLIEIEITETTSQANQFLSVSIIKKLRQNGIRILMDDFGIGYSNISNLRRIPFDAVKIDKSYVDNIATDERAKEVVRLSIGLCKISGLEVIAEGADSKEQIDILRRAKCDVIQGFYYSQALPKDKYDRFLIDNPYEENVGGAIE
nr:EAL domain-containing protein [Bacilli bacterium]